MERVQGAFDLEGEHDVSNAIIEKLIQMSEDNTVRYVALQDCTARVQEVLNERRDERVAQGLKGYFRTVSRPAGIEADTCSDLRLHQCLTRRGLALDMAGLMSFTVHEKLRKALV